MQLPIKSRSLLLLAILVAVPIIAFKVNFYERPFADRKAVLEEVVERVRRMHLAPGTVADFKLDNLDDAKSLHPIGPNVYPHYETGMVFVRVCPGGALQVAVLTYDWGHFGRSGFAYSDEHLTLDTDDDGLPWLDLYGPLKYAGPDKEIAPHWWKVHSYGD